MLPLGLSADWRRLTTWFASISNFGINLHNTVICLNLRRSAIASKMLIQADLSLTYGTGTWCLIMTRDA